MDVKMISMFGRGRGQRERGFGWGEGGCDGVWVGQNVGIFTGVLIKNYLHPYFAKEKKWSFRIQLSPSPYFLGSFTP